MRHGAISLMDVLGWKGIWQRKTDAISVLKSLIRASQVWIDSYKGDSIMSSHLSNLTVEIRSISDTIALVTYGDDINKAIEFHGIINRFLVCNSISRKIPLRGATAYGELELSENIMIGPAVDEVAAWYEASDWIGVFLTPSALFQLNTTNFFGSRFNLESETGIYTRYNVQIKGMGAYDTYCVNWPTIWENGRQGLTQNFLKMGPITPSIASKYINTLKFFDEQRLQGSEI